MSFLISFIKSLIAREPARLAAYGGSILLALALMAANRVGVTLPPEVVTGIQAFGILIVTELIRRFVFAPATVAAITSPPTTPVAPPAA